MRGQRGLLAAAFGLALVLMVVQLILMGRLKGKRPEAFMLALSIVEAFAGLYASGAWAIGMIAR